ncbi:MAG: DUF2934 domain-containing protein [Nitrospira sp.]|nr:DUF2934 domain-containing protein [Nitrospira sp.]
MARRTSGEQKEASNNEPRVSVAKVGKTVSSRRATQRELFSVGPASARVETQVEGQDHLHRQIAELAYLLYERSGFQDGNDLEHWLEAERKIRGVRDRAA